MSKIEGIKTYVGQNLDTVFFRPMLTGPSAEQLGVKVMYNVPVPTTLNFWQRQPDVLKKFVGRWQGGSRSQKFQKQIVLNRVKAEGCYAATDYFTTVFERIAAQPDVNFEDLSGTELEKAETDLFRQAISESIRVTMWYGDTSRSSNFNSFDGVLKKIIFDHDSDSTHIGYNKQVGDGGAWAEKLLKDMWENSREQLKALRSEGNLAFFVTSDIYNAYEDSLDNVAIESAYLARQSGRDRLYYRGIPVVDLQLNEYKYQIGTLPKSFAILTDRRNIALAVNTNDFPGSEVRLWYNPDEMENRQRAVFAAGCDYLLPELMTVAFESAVGVESCSYDGSEFSVTVNYGSDVSDLEYVFVNVFDAKGEIDCDNEEMTIEASTKQSFQYPISTFSRAELVIHHTNGYSHRIFLEPQL